MRLAPAVIQQFLRTHPEDVMSSYAKLKAALESYHVRGETYSWGADDAAAPETGATPMEFGAVEAIAKGKGKGKKTVMCWTCGKQGHRAPECRSGPPCPEWKGGGKGSGK
eukprot:4780368-Heterocapsa_arctica.AAC.1